MGQAFDIVSSTTSKGAYVSDIRIDYTRLDAAHSRLTTVISDFDSAGGVNAHLSEATGHPYLSGVVEDFRSSWEIRRGQLTEELRFINESVQAIHDTFQDLDAELTKRLTVLGEQQ